MATVSARELDLTGVFRDPMPDRQAPDTIAGSSMDPDDRHGFRRSWEDGTVQRIGGIDTEEFSKGNGPTIPGFNDQDLSDQEDRIRSQNMGMKSPVDHLKSTPAGMMRKDIEESIERGYESLSRGTKIRVLKELMEKYQHEGEDIRQATRSVKRK